MKTTQWEETAAIIGVRLAVGVAVFFPEGLQKLLFADILGAGRFAKIGIPWRERNLDHE